MCVFVTFEHAGQQLQGQGVGGGERDFGMR